MKMILAVLLIFYCFSPLSFAQDNDQLARIKQETLSHLDQRIAHLQETKSCVSSANDQEQLKKCRENLKKENKALHEENKNKRIQRIEEKIKRMEEKKAQMQKSN